MKIPRKFRISYSSLIILLTDKRDGNIYMYSSEISKQVNVFSVQKGK